jgi:hypothetical protein
MLLLVRRYWGIDHDATLYLGQALAQRWPENFGHDLFFLHGSQADYTVFPFLTGHLVGWFDPISVFFWGGLAGLLLFAAAGWYCLRALLPQGQRYWSWLAVLVLPSFYGRAIIFSYAEPFLTPRPFAEGMCLIAIGLLARGRMVAALACLAVSAMLHPLQAIGATLVIWPWLVMQDRRWLHALWLAVPITVAAFAGVEPFTGLFTPLGDQWLSQLRAINGQLFVTGWALMDYRILAFDVLVLTCAARASGGDFGRWCVAALAGLGIGIVASLLLVDALHLALPAGLQLWRVHWLAHWLAMVALAGLLAFQARERDLARIALLGLTALLAWGQLEWLWLPFGGLYAAWPRLKAHLRAHVRTLLTGLFGVGIAIMLLHHIASELANFQAAHSRLDLYALDKRLLAFPVFALGIPFLASHAWNCAGRASRNATALLLCPMLLIAILRWDIRAPDRQTLDAHSNTPAIFGVKMPNDALVYWDSMSLVGPWSVLRRSEYYDPQQLSGLAFNRATMADAVGRIARMTPLIEESADCQQMPAAADPANACRISDASMRQACRPGDTLRPDYLILPYRQSEPALGTWTMRDGATGQPITTFWLYRCDDVARANAAQPGGTD